MIISELLLRHFKFKINSYFNAMNNLVIKGEIMKWSSKNYRIRLINCKKGIRMWETSRIKW